MRIIDEVEVAGRLARIDLPALMERALRAQARGAGCSPVRAFLTTPEGAWFAAMPAWIDDGAAALGAKLVIAMPHNAARGLPTHRAVVVLLDPATGAPQAWIDGESITAARTAAVSVVATRTLARRPRGVHAILGGGVQARAHLDAFARANLVDELVVWARAAPHAEEVASAARARGIRAAVAADADEAVRRAHVVTTCTASASPLFTAASLQADAHVNAVGACVPTKRELPGAVVGAAALVVDDLAAAHAESGDVVLAVAEGAASWDGVVTLGEVLEGASPRPGAPTVFISLGMGIEDVAAASAIVALG